MISATERAPGLRSVGVKLAMAVVFALGCSSLAVGYGVSALALGYLVEGKQKAAVMVVDAASPALAPALDFADDAAVVEHAQRILASRDVSAVAVWSVQREQPILMQPQRSLACPPDDAVEVAESFIRVSRAIANPRGQRVGSVCVQFSLAPEVAAFRRVRAHIYVATGLLSLVLAVLVIALVRIIMLRPLSRLLGAMSSLSAGKTVELDDARRDELGQLKRGFNDMARAIADREQRLEQARRRTQELLDHMREAILVFDLDGRLLDLRSRHADALFGAPASGQLVSEVLFPDETSVERDLFEQWLEAVLSLPADRFAEVQDLAPAEARLARNGENRHLALRFIPITEQGAITRIMVLCTDLTEERRLMRAVETKEVEHEQQMRAMRTLVAGGGQLLVGVLRRAAERIEQSRACLRGETVSRADLDRIFQLIHTVKGEARVFEQNHVTRIAASLECELGVLRAATETSVMDGAVARDHLEAVLKELEAALHGAERMLVAASPIGRAILDQVTVRKSDVEELMAATRGRHDHVAALAERLASRPFGECVFNLPEAVARWADTLQKRALLDLRGGDVPIPPTLGAILPGIVAHLVRNAVAHGIEGPLVREELGKPAVAIISVSAVQTESGVLIEVSDDGRGAPSGADLFEPGVTTAGQTERAADLAGHGMGLSAVRADLTGVGYSISVLTRPGQGLTARIQPEQRVS